MRTLLATALALMTTLHVVPLVVAQTAAPPRSNPVIKLLEQGKPAFSIWANYIGVGNVRDIARTLKAANIKAVLWAGSGDMSLSYGHDAALTSAGLDKVIAAGNEFGLPVGINGTTDFKRRYSQGVRVFFDLGPSYAASGPSISPEERKAVGR